MCSRSSSRREAGGEREVRGPGPEEERTLAVKLPTLDPVLDLSQGDFDFLTRAVAGRMLTIVQKTNEQNAT